MLVADEAQPSILSVAAPSSVTGSFVATMTVRNTGAHAATLTTAGLRLFDPSGADVTGRFSIAARAGNPTSVAALVGTATLQFDVSPLLGSSGVHTIDGVMGASDSSTQANVSPTGGADTVAYSMLSIPPAPILAFGSLTAPATVSRGQAFSASLEITNSGDAAAGITSTSLSFTGSGLTATPRGNNPSAVAAGSTTSFLFDVTVGSDASTGPRTATFVLHARNAFSSADASRAVSLAPSVTVQAVPAFAAGALAIPSPVSRGQVFTAAVVVTNTGGATADLGSASLSFSTSGLAAVADGDGRGIKGYYWQLVSSPPGVRPFTSTKVRFSYLMAKGGSYTFRLTAFNSSFGAASDFSDSDAGEQLGSLQVGLPTVVTLTGTLLGAEGLAYAAYDYRWEQVDGPDATLSKYVDSATPRTSSSVTFEPTTAGLYEFELRMSPRDENDLAVDLQFIRRIRVKVTSAGLRAPTVQASSNQATVPGTGPRSRCVAPAAGRWLTGTGARSRWPRLLDLH